MCSREKGGPAVPQARAARGVCTLCVCVSRARSLFPLADGTVPPHTHLAPPDALACSPEEIMEIDLPTGIPFKYELSLPDLKPVGEMTFLGDDETVAKAIAKVKKQGTAKK